MEGLEATVYINGTICMDASFPVRRGIRQGCPTSGSVCALLFYPMLNYKKYVVVNLSPQTTHGVRCLLQEIPGAWQFLVVGAAAYLGVPIGPCAVETFWDKAMSKYSARARAIRHAPGHMQDKLGAYRMYAASVRHYLGQYAAPPAALASRGGVSRLVPRGPDARHHR